MIKASLLVLWVAIFLFAFLQCSKRRKLQVLTLLVLFGLPFLIFTNLHRVHSYYQAANALWLSLALALAVIGAYEAGSPARRRLLVGLHAFLVVLFVGNALWYFHFKSSHRYERAEFADAIADQSEAESVLVITGMHWSPELPYMANRRALMLPKAFPEGVKLQALQDLKASGYAVDSYVTCDEAEIDPLVARHFELAEEPISTLGDCRLYRMMWHELEPAGQS